MDKYKPGVCNIGFKQRRIRLILGIISLVLALVYLLFIKVIGLSKVLNLLNLLLIFYGVIGIMQYQMHFCAEFGILGKYDFDKGKFSVEEKKALTQDRIKAFKIILYSLLISITLTLILFLVS
jgi:hypothetical protein